MEQLSLTPVRRQPPRRAWGRTVDAFDTVAWRPPVARRVDARPANDGCEPGLREMAEGLPAWFTVLVGGAVAALMGALLGGALQV